MLVDMSPQIVPLFGWWLASAAMVYLIVSGLMGLVSAIVGNVMNRRRKRRADSTG